MTLNRIMIRLWDAWDVEVPPVPFKLLNNSVWTTDRGKAIQDALDICCALSEGEEGWSVNYDSH